MAQRVPIGSHVPIHPQPCDPAVGKDVQSYVGRMNRADLQDVVRIATERGSLHGRLPRSTLEIVVRRRSRHETDVHTAGVGIIALEMRRLDVDAVDHARRAELDDALVVREIETGFAWEHVAAPA